MGEKIITYEWLVKEKACYYTEGHKLSLGEWLNTKLPLSIEEFSELEISPIDKLWVYYRLMDENQLRLSARRNALPALKMCDVSTETKEWISSGDEALREDAKISMMSLISSSAGDITPTVKRSMKALLWSCDDNSFDSAIRSAISISVVDGERMDNIKKMKNEALSMLKGNPSNRV